MKKTILIIGLLVVALGVLGVGVVFAQEGGPPYGNRGVADGSGYLHEYMEKAMADALGLNLEEFQTRHASETFYQIALSKGFTAEEIPALMQDARASALDEAAKNGAISQEQAEWMKSRGFGRGGRHGGGYGSAGCPLGNSFDGTVQPGQQGSNRGFGRGGMRNWNNQY